MEITKPIRSIFACTLNETGLLIFNCYLFLGDGIHAFTDNAVPRRLRTLQDSDTARQTEMFQVYIVSGCSEPTYLWTRS